MKAKEGDPVVVQWSPAKHNGRIERGEISYLGPDERHGRIGVKVIFISALDSRTDIASTFDDEIFISASHIDSSKSENQEDEQSSNTALPQMTIMHPRAYEDQNPEEVNRGIFRKILDITRQWAAREGLKLGFITLVNGDLNRAYRIASVINGQRVFYNSYEDETPEACLNSVTSAAERIDRYIHEEGVWGLRSVESLCRRIHFHLQNWRTAMQNLEPFPKLPIDKNWERFCAETGELRMAVWHLVSLIRSECGDSIPISNMPPQVQDLIRDYSQQNSNESS